MNNVRRKKIEAIKDQISVIMDKLNDLLNEEQDYFDNIPENLQCSIRADESQDAIDTMEEATDGLEEIIDKLEEII